MWSKETTVNFWTEIQVEFLEFCYWNCSCFIMGLELPPDRISSNPLNYCCQVLTNLGLSGLFSAKMNREMLVVFAPFIQKCLCEWENQSHSWCLNWLPFPVLGWRYSHWRWRRSGWVKCGQTSRSAGTDWSREYKTVSVLVMRGVQNSINWSLPLTFFFFFPSFFTFYILFCFPI